MQCEMTKKQLTKRGVDFELMDLSKDAKQLKQFTEAGYAQAPVVVTPKKTWSGFRLTDIQDIAHEVFSEKNREQAS